MQRNVPGDSVIDCGRVRDGSVLSESFGRRCILYRPFTLWWVSQFELHVVIYLGSVIFSDLRTGMEPVLYILYNPHVQVIVVRGLKDVQ